MSQPSAALETLIATIRLVAFDFDGVFTDNTVYVSEDGAECVRCWRGDGLGLRKLERLGIAAIIISTEINPVISVRAQKLKIPYLQGIADKRATLETVAHDQGVSLSQVAFIGNDINDLTCLTCVGLPVAVQDAHPDILDFVRYRTQATGGRGAVRELCDLFEKVHARRSL